MKAAEWSPIVGLLFALGACALAPQYPETLGSDIDPNFDFRNLKLALEQYKRSVFQVAGEMVRIESGGEGIRVLANRKWIQWQLKYPWYIPVEAGEPPNDPFVLIYPSRIDAQALVLGNKFIAVAELVGTSGDLLEFRARCLHVWKTGHNRISELPDRFIQLYQALEEDTYCAPGN